MPLYPIFFTVVVFSGWMSGLFKGPIWSLLTYIYVYFNIPSHQWWGEYFPLVGLRWSFLTAIMFAITLVLHGESLNRTYIKEEREFVYLVLYSIWMIITVPFSANTDIAITKIYDFIRYAIIVIFIGLTVKDIDQLIKYILCILANAAFIAWTAGFYFHGMRLDGVGTVDASGANELAILMLSLIPLLLAFMLKGSKYVRLLSIIFLPLMINAFAMCRSRGGMLGLGVAISFLVFQEKDPRLKKRICVGVILVATALFFLMDNSFKNRLIGLTDQNVDSATLSAGRTLIWSYGIEMLKDYPLGAGGGNFMYLSPQYLPNNIIEKHVGVRNSHNTLLTIAVEQGFVGVFIFVLFFKQCFLSIKKSKVHLYKILDDQPISEKQKRNVEYLLILCNGIVASLTGIIVAGFFTDRLYYEGFYLIAALCPVMHQISKKMLLEQGASKCVG